MVVIRNLWMCTLVLVLWGLKHRHSNQWNKNNGTFECERRERGQRRGQWWRGGGGGERRWIQVIISATKSGSEKSDSSNHCHSFTTNFNTTSNSSTDHSSTLSIISLSTFSAPQRENANKKNNTNQYLVPHSFLCIVTTDLFIFLVIKLNTWVRCACGKVWNLFQNQDEQFDEKF